MLLKQAIWYGHLCLALGDLNILTLYIFQYPTTLQLHQSVDELKNKQLCFEEGDVVGEIGNLPTALLVFGACTPNEEFLQTTSQNCSRTL